MTKQSDLLAALGDATLAENIRRAVEAGDLIEHDDGSFELPRRPSNKTSWVFVAHGPPPRCAFLKGFLFFQVYGGSTVPYGCRDCYKVHVTPRTLRELVAAWQVGKDIECSSKWGINCENPYSRSCYSGVFYAAGLEMARAVFRAARAAFDADPRLGPSLEMAIKRACSEYEAAVGPSDRYAFPPELERLESYLDSRFRGRTLVAQDSAPIARWIDVASRIGDDTYLDFTDGKRLRPKRVTYDP